MVAADVRDVTTRLGSEIEQRMQARGLNYDMLAIETKIGRSRLQRIAKGDRLQWIHPDELEVIAQALGTSQLHLLSVAGFRVNEAQGTENVGTI